MMGYGSYGHGGFSSSSSNLSALAPPFTVSPKPNSSPLVDLTEPSYGVPLSSSLHNWLPPNYPNSGPGFFSNHNSEFNPMPSSNAFSYPSLQDIKSPNTHLPPVNPIASASADAFLGGQCSDGVATSLVEDKRYYPTYVPPAIQDHSPLVAPDEINYDCFSSSHVATLDRSSKNDYILPGLGYTADWGESQNRLGDWEHGKQVELEGSFCSKGIYKNYMNQGISTLPYNISLPLSVLLWFNFIGQIVLRLNLCYPCKFRIFHSFHYFTQLLFLVLCGPWLMSWPCIGLELLLGC